MKTTKQDYATFKKYADYWLKELGLTDWHVYFKHGKLSDAYAQTSYHVSSRTATMTFNTSWDEYRPITDDSIRKNALHETLHILTAPLFVEGTARYTTELDIEAAEHSIVTRLTNYIANDS